MRKCLIVFEPRKHSNLIFLRVNTTQDRLERIKERHMKCVIDVGMTRLVFECWIRIIRLEHQSAHLDNLVDTILPLGEVARNGFSNLFDEH